MRGSPLRLWDLLEMVSAGCSKRQKSISHGWRESVFRQCWNCQTAGDRENRSWFSDTEMSCFLNKDLKLMEMYMLQRKTDVQEQREMFWMRSVRMIIEADAIFA